MTASRETCKTKTETYLRGDDACQHIHQLKTYCAFVFPSQHKEELQETIATSIRDNMTITGLVTTRIKDVQAAVCFKCSRCVHTTLRATCLSMPVLHFNKHVMTPTKGALVQCRVQNSFLLMLLDGRTKREPPRELFSKAST